MTHAAEKDVPPCPHLSWSGIDTYFGPGKVMECDCCGTRKAEDWPSPGAFCERHFSWLCQAGQGQCQRPVEEPVSFRQATDGAHTRVIPPGKS